MPIRDGEQQEFIDASEITIGDNIYNCLWPIFHGYYNTGETTITKLAGHMVNSSQDAKDLLDSCISRCKNNSWVGLISYANERISGFLFATIYAGPSGVGKIAEIHYIHAAVHGSKMDEQDSQKREESLQVTTALIAELCKKSGVEQVIITADGRHPEQNELITEYSFSPYGDNYQNICEAASFSAGHQL